MSDWRQQLGIGILASLIAALLVWRVDWFWHQGYRDLDTPGILLILATILATARLFWDVREWLKQRSSTKLRKAEPKWTILVRKIKEDFEAGYSELVVKSLVSLYRPDFPRKSSRDEGGLSQILRHHLASGHRAFLEEWEKHMAFREFQVKTSDLPDAISREEFDEIAGLYRASINGYLNLRSKFESMIQGKEAIARQTNREGALQAAATSWDELRAKLDLYEEKLRALNNHLRAHGVNLTFEGGSTLTSPVP